MHLLLEREQLVRAESSASVAMLELINYAYYSFMIEMTDLLSVVEV
jgi:hypothetical protein